MPNPSRAPATADASKSPGTGRASPSGSRPYRVQNIFGFALIAIVPLSVGLVQGAGDGRLGDTDVYSWLNRVQNLRSSGAWFDETIVRVNPPVGHVQHWSRPFDLVLLIGGLIGEPFVGFRNAVVAWAVILPVLAGVVTAWLLLRYFGDLLG